MVTFARSMRDLSAHAFTDEAWEDVWTTSSGSPTAADRRRRPVHDPHPHRRLRLLVTAP